MNKIKMSTERDKQIRGLKNIITELKYLIQWISSRLDQSEESANSKTSHLKLLSQRNKKEKEQRKVKKAKKIMGYHWLNQYVCYGSLRRRTEKEWGRQLMWRNNGHKLPKSEEEMYIHIQKVQKTPTRRKPKKPTPRPIIKLSSQGQRKNLESSKRKYSSFKGAPTKLSADFSAKMLQARR